MYFSIKCVYCSAIIFSLAPSDSLPPERLRYIGRRESRLEFSGRECLATHFWQEKNFRWLLNKFWKSGWPWRWQNTWINTFANAYQINCANTNTWFQRARTTSEKTSTSIKNLQLELESQKKRKEQDKHGSKRENLTKSFAHYVKENSDGKRRPQEEKFNESQNKDKTESVEPKQKLCLRSL